MTLAWDEAFSVVPLIHLPAAAGQRMLVMGESAAPMVALALRYPTTREVVVINCPAPQDNRVRAVKNINELPSNWMADLLAVAIPGITDPILQALKSVHASDTGVAVFAVDNPANLRPVRDLLRRRWSITQPYRDYVGAPAPAWFVLAADHGFKRQRPVPGNTVRLSEKYLPALFTLAKDEYAQAYGNAP